MIVTLHGEKQNRHNQKKDTDFLVKSKVIKRFSRPR